MPSCHSFIVKERMRYFTRFVAYLWMLLILCSVKAFISNGNGRYFVRLKPNENGELFAQFPRSKSPTSSSNSSPRKSSQPTSQSHPASSLSSQAPKPISKPPNFAMKNIQGKSTIICREFKIDSPKTYDFLGSFRALSQLPNYPLPEIAFIGRSNVGKSSLINCLTNLNKKVVITSKTPGRTQGINLIKCSDRDGEICILSDLPGYGYAKISKELQFEISEFVNEYLMRRASLKLCVVLIDARREPLESDYNTLKSLAENGIPFGIVLTKSDLVSKAELPKVTQKIKELYALPEGQPILFSALSGDGRKNVWRLIKRSILDENFGNGENNDDDNENDDEIEIDESVTDFSKVKS